MITFHPSQIEGSRSATQAISKSVAKMNFDLTSTYLNSFELNNCLAGTPWMLSRLSVAPSRNRFFVLRVHIHRVDHGNVPPQGLASEQLSCDTHRNIQKHIGTSAAKHAKPYIPVQPGTDYMITRYPNPPVKHAAKIDFCSEFRGVEGDVALRRSLHEQSLKIWAAITMLNWTLGQNWSQNRSQSLGDGVLRLKHYKRIPILIAANDYYVVTERCTNLAWQNTSCWLTKSPASLQQSAGHVFKPLSDRSRQCRMQLLRPYPQRFSGLGPERWPPIPSGLPSQEVIERMPQPRGFNYHSLQVLPTLPSKSQ